MFHRHKEHDLIPVSSVASLRSSWREKGKMVAFAEKKEEMEGDEGVLCRVVC